jgi:hypothetical protein
MLKRGKLLQESTASLVGKGLGRYRKQEITPPDDFPSLNHMNLLL